MNNEKITALIQEILSQLGVEVDSITEETLEGPTQTLLFVVKTSVGQELVDRGGAGVQALNHIVQRIVSARTDEPKKFTIDINGHYKEELEKIKQRAQVAAERARSFETDIALEPMNSFERLIVHSLFPEDGDIKTHSEGVGRERHIVLSYAAEN